ncbi:11654_t:CDS:2 [Acaulospora morrowiae]|uniref:Histone H1 n=1 Tax=Acaulospora morrowiae TaxID=94023 RepID=A0A9N8WEJ4_9GLOM|nr:11654_t:CDS:2 [Acaulospora morrowiae]
MTTQHNQFMLSSESTTNSVSKTDSTSHRREVFHDNEQNSQKQQEEWGDEDGEFELEEEVHAEVSEVKSENGTTRTISQKKCVTEHAKLNERISGRNSLSRFPQTNKTPTKEADVKLQKTISETTDVGTQPLSSTIESDKSPKTKYGRKVHKPVLFTHDSRDTKRQPQETKRPNKSTVKRQRNLRETSPTLTPPNSLSVTSSTTSPISSNVSKNFSEDASSDTQDTPRSKLDDIVCIVCHDGQSPKHNRIVLCDKCDVPYHQQCHVPSIEDRVAEITTAEWMCSKCEEAKGRKRRKVEPRVSTSNNNLRDISGNGLTEEQKIAYLSSLPQRVLIDLILIAEKLHPDLPLYPADVKEQISSNAYTAASNKNEVDNRPASKDHLSHSSTVPLTSNTQSSKTYSDSTDPSRAHLPAVGVDLPSYEEMIVQALLSIADPAGSAPRNIFEWMNNTYPLHKNFRASASQALQKAVKKGRVFRIGTVYKLNENYKPAKRIRRYFKKPQSPNEHQSYKDDVTPEDDQDGIFEIAVRLDDSENFTAVQGLEMDDHPSISSSAVSTPAPHVISNGHVEITSPEENSSIDDTSNKIVPALVNESSNAMNSIMQNQSILPPVRGRGVTSNIGSGVSLPSTLLPPPVQPTLPSLSSVAYFSSGYGGNKPNSIYTSYQYTSPTGTYNTGLPAIVTLPRDEGVINAGLSTDASHLQ